MKRNTRLLLVILVLAATLTALAGPAAANPRQQNPERDSTLRVPAQGAQGEDIVPGRVVVKFAPNASASQRSLAMSGLSFAEQSDVVGTVILNVSQGQEMETAARLAAMGGVEFAEPEYVYRAHLVPDDTYYASHQWNLPHINLPTAWDTTTGAASVTIAVLDTGVDIWHDDLLGQTVSGYDFVNGDSNPQDDRGHGTHVAGIVGAASNNSWGVAGVSWGSKIMPIKVLDNNGDGSSTDVAAGIIWAVDNGADIINMSLGGTGYSAQVAAAVTYAYTSGLTLFASMGNEYEDGNPVEYPAALPYVIAVGAVGDTDVHASYSCTGAHNDVVAPGGDPSSAMDPEPGHWIMSTYWSGSGYEYAQMSGTSQACPHVAGLAALMLAANPSITNAQIEQILKDTAIDLGDAGFDEFYGYGRVDAAAAVSAAATAGTPTPTEAPTDTPTMTPTMTSTMTPTATETSEPSLTPTTELTDTPTATATSTITPTMTLTPTSTVTPTMSVTPTLTITPTETVTPTMTETPDAPTATATSDPYGYPTPTPTVEPTTAGTLYLPLIMRMPAQIVVTPTTTSTPTATALPTATLSPGDELIINGGFEDDAAWWFEPTTYTGGYCSTMARTGSRSARLGITDAGDNVYSYSVGRQWVTIPADATSAQLRFWVYQQSGDAGATSLNATRAKLNRVKTLKEFREALAANPADAQYALILRWNGVVEEVLFYESANVDGWSERVFDLSEYKGQYIAVHFGTLNDGYNGITSMHVDDVSLLVETP